MKNKLFWGIGSGVVIILSFIVYGSIKDKKPSIPQSSDTSVSSDVQFAKTVGRKTEITFEEAVNLKMIYDDIPQEIAQKALIKEEERVLQDIAQRQKQTSDKAIEEIKSNMNPRDNIKYYSFMGEFDYPKNTDFKGKPEAMIVVVNTTDSDGYIDRVDWISTELTSGTNDIQWVQMDVSSNIAAGKTSARLSAMGYFTVLKNSKISENLSTIDFENPSEKSEKYLLYSETVYPVLNFYTLDSKK